MGFLKILSMKGGPLSKLGGMRTEKIRAGMSRARILLIVSLCLIGVSALVAPDIQTFENNLNMAKTAHEKERKQVESMKVLAAKIGDSKVPLIPVEDATYLAYYLGATEGQIKYFDSYLDFVIPFKGPSGATESPDKDLAFSVTGPMIGSRLAAAIEVLNKNCSVQKLWPELTVRVYTTN